MEPSVKQALIDKIVEQEIKKIPHMHFVLGYQCNVRCDFCYQKSWSPKDDLPLDVIQSKILPRLAELDSFVIQGGEPTVMKNCAMIRDPFLSINSKAHVMLVTNGVRFKDEWATFMQGRYGALYVSINASCKEVYDKVVKYGDFDAVMENLTRFMQNKKQAGDKYPVVRVSFVISEKNMWDILDFYRMASKLGVDHVQYYIDCRSPFPSFLTALSDEKLEEYLLLVRETIKTIQEDNFPTTELPAVEHYIQLLQIDRAKAIA